MVVFKFIKTIFLFFYLVKHSTFSKETTPSIINNSTKNSVLNHKQVTNINETFYVRSAFRVSNDVIRLTVLKSAFNRKKLHWYLNGKYGGIVKLKCNSKTCPNAWVPELYMVGYVGIIVSYRNISLDKSNFIMLSNESNNTRIYVPVIDRRRPVNFKKYPHVLGVCVLPLFHYYDYLELIRYIESLLMHGATYFYFYHQSSTFNILKVIDYYKINAKNVTFEIVDWSLLPETNANPNDYIHRLEPSLAIFDCMYRGRYIVQFAAQLDLDEVVAMNTSKYSSLTDYLMMSSKKDNKIASYSFRSSRARLYKETTTLEELKKQKFNNYKSIKLTYPHPRPVYTKLIYRPEYMFNFYIHFPLETDYLLNETYSHYNLSLSEGTIHHFRIINNKRHFKKYLERKSNYYSSKIKQLNSNLSQHLTKLFLIDEKQLPQIKKAVQQYNLCRYEEYLKGKTGLVPFTCRNIMSHEITKNFIVSIHSWLVI